jgi:probable phosphomutase (TIGR03848 family)
VTTVLLIRHGRTAANTSGILAGRTSGVELDDVGMKQATEMAARIGSVPLRAIVTSPLRRCRQTAQALQAAHADGCRTIVDQALVECGYGDWTGRSLRDLSKDKLWRSVQQQPSAVRFPGGESLTEMSSRAVGAIRGWDRRLDAEYGDQAVWAAISHGDVIKAILADALGMHLDAFQRLVVDPGSVSIVRYTAIRPYVVTMNSTVGDLAGLFRTRPKKTRRRRPKEEHDAPVGGGLGAQEAID